MSSPHSGLCTNGPSRTTQVSRAPSRPAIPGTRSLQPCSRSLFPPPASVSRPQPFAGSRLPNPGRGCGPRTKPRPQGSLIFAPAPGSAPPREATGGPAGAAAFCVFRFEVRETPQPYAASPRGPRRLLSASPAPLLGSACQLGARWFAPRGARRRGEGPQPPPPRVAPEPSRAGGTRRRRSCGPDCSSGPPASRSCCRAPRPAATPGGRRRGTSGLRDAGWAPTSASRDSGAAAALAGRPPWAVGTAPFPSAPLAVGVASASLPMSVPARTESKGPPAQKPTDPAGNMAVTSPVTTAAVRRWPECAPWASP